MSLSRTKSWAIVAFFRRFELAILIVLLSALCLFVAWLRMQVKTSKMRSQCAVLASDLRREIHASGDDIRLDLFLEAYAKKSKRGLFTVGTDGTLRDVWGNPFFFESDDAGQSGILVVGSRGRDGVKGTNDDFTVYVKGKSCSQPQ